MKKSSVFPFYAGQRTDKQFGSSHVLSPLPIRSVLSKAKRCDQLMNKDSISIDVGGAGGIIFQTQLMWLCFLIGFLSFLWFYVAFDGFTGLYQKSFKNVFIDNRWHKDFQVFQFVLAMFGTLAPLFGALFINYKIAVSARELLSQTLPVRFHRQRREVLFSRWNEELKKTETRIVPWEQVCAMVGQSRTVSTGGVMSSATLMIAANDEDHYGHFWSALQIGSIDKFHAASIWEMIRVFMEEGPDAIGDPSPLTLEGVIEEHCAAHEIQRDEFSSATRLWWYINGTMLGIWRTNYEMSRLKRRTDDFPDVVEWSKPLPEEQWQKPSAELNYVNDMLARNEYAQGHTIFSIGDACSRYMQTWQEKQA